MSYQDRLKILQQGAEAWNKWRIENPDDETYLQGASISRVSLSRADLHGMDLSWASLRGVDLSWADLHNANLHMANLIGANLHGANLHGANLYQALLYQADLTDTDLTAADLSYASLVEATLVRTKLTGCRIYGISAWGLKTKESTQNGIIITPRGDPEITVDNLQVAQFIYSLLNNEDIRQVIDTITSKVVLILGRFTPERKAVLDALRDELRKRDYLPVMFDFKKPANRDLTETISILAHMARFIIADITDAKSIPAELQCIVPNLPSVPIMPLVLHSDDGYALFEHIRRFGWVLEPYQYESQAELIASIGERVIAPAESKVKELQTPK